MIVAAQSAWELVSGPIEVIRCDGFDVLLRFMSVSSGEGGS